MDFSSSPAASLLVLFVLIVAAVYAGSDSFSVANGTSPQPPSPKSSPPALPFRGHHVAEAPVPPSIVSGNVSTPAVSTDFVVHDANGFACIRASFKTALLVSYVQLIAGKLHLKETMMSVPLSAKVEGSCSEISHRMFLSWHAGHTLSMHFRRQKLAARSPVVAAGAVGWAANRIFLKLNTSGDTFTSANRPGEHKLETRSKLQHFWAPSNRSYACTSKQLVVVHERAGRDDAVHKALLELWDVHVQAFDLPASGQFSQAAVCPADLLGKVTVPSFAPVIIAASLAVVVTIIIAAYAVNKHVTGDTYRAME